MGIKSGDTVEISADGVVQTIKAYVTDFIHPTAVYTLHGYGREIPLQSRAFKKGMRDNTLMKGLLKVSIGGNVPMTDCFVNVRKVS
jgi:thiosulfate reductase/polysulfide reductase chain A